MAWTYEELAAALDATSTWRDLDGEARKAERDRVAGGGYPFNLDLLDSWVFADGENLAEGGVEEFLAELAPIVARAGVDLRVRRLVDPYGGLVKNRDTPELAR